ncbi:MAG: sulfate transporter [Deltaproteobacteria bacterium]|nr:MAG: sulfate transporter [Deltaproteobacteria bacterium]
MNAVDLKDYMEDGQGRLVHVDNVKEIDKTRDGLVQHLISNALELEKAMVNFKEQSTSEIDAFVDLSAMEYDVKLGGKKGNLTLYSYDMKFKVQVQVSEFIVFDERLQVAKKMIDECFNEWAKGSPSELKTIINDAFQVDKEGNINSKRVMDLRRHKFDHAIWQRAMEVIADSVKIVGSKRYVRFYSRKDNQDQWQNISLDMAAL